MISADNSIATTHLVDKVFASGDDNITRFAAIRKIEIHDVPKPSIGTILLNSLRRTADDLTSRVIEPAAQTAEEVIRQRVAGTLMELAEHFYPHFGPTVPVGATTTTEFASSDVTQSLANETRTLSDARTQEITARLGDQNGSENTHRLAENQSTELYPTEPAAALEQACSLADDRIAEIVSRLFDGPSHMIREQFTPDEVAELGTAAAVRKAEPAKQRQAALAFLDTQIEQNAAAHLEAVKKLDDFAATSLAQNNARLHHLQTVITVDQVQTATQELP